MKGIYYENYVPSNKPKKLKKNEFLAEVNKKINNPSLIDSESASIAVFSMLKKRVSEGEMKDVKATLPKDLQNFFKKGGKKNEDNGFRQSA